MPIVQFEIKDEEEIMIRALMPLLKTKARTKVFKKALKITYNQFLISGQLKPVAKSPEPI